MALKLFKFQEQLMIDTFFIILTHVASIVSFYSAGKFHFRN